jgi:hypothetical protein
MLANFGLFVVPFSHLLPQLTGKKVGAKAPALGRNKQATCIMVYVVFLHSMSLRWPHAQSNTDVFDSKASC